jgi:hypothetical protein
VLSGFSKSAGKGLCCGIKGPSLETAHLCLGQSVFIFGQGAWDVCVGDHSLDVMNRWEVARMKMRHRPGKAEWNDVGGSAGHFSKSARSGARH